MQKANDKLGTRIHIIYDKFMGEPISILDTFDECKELLKTLADGEYCISTWEYTNSLKWEFSEASAYLIKNGLVYKAKYICEDVNTVD